MRTDHIEKLNSACSNLARLVESVLAEHREQIRSMEHIMRSTGSAAGKSSALTSSTATESERLGDTPVSASEGKPSDLYGMRSALDAVARALEGDR